MIRRVTPGDRDVFIAMGHEFYHSAAVLHPIPDSHISATFDQVVAGNPMADAFLLEQEGKTAGYAVLAVTWSNEAGGKAIWLEELYIAPEFQGKGLGREFFAFVEQEYAGKAARFRLEVARGNTGAIRLYERLGYVEFDYYQMVKDLEPGGGI